MNKKKKKIYFISPRENPISFLKDFLLPGERKERIKENGRIVLFIVKYLSYYKFYQALLKRIIFFFPINYLYQFVN